MATAYVLEQKVLGPHRRLPITEEEFLALKAARQVLSEALPFEQRYELLVGNFIEMELSLTEFCLRSTIEPQYAYLDIARVIQEANRRIGNLLTAAKGYIDQVKQDFKSLSLSPKFSESVDALLQQEYDSSIEYRFMEALRNYTQHRAFPATKFSGAVIPDDDANGWVESVAIFSRKDELFRDKKFKQKFLDALPTEIDLRRYGREYVRCLGKAHIALRALIQPAVTQARTLVDTTIQRYGDSGANPTIGLCARRMNNGPEDVSVMTDWDDVRVKLALKNCWPPDLWPRQRGNEPSGADLRALRERAGHSVEQAARLAFVSPVRWEHYESGLRVPKSVHVLYMLQTDQHRTHEVIPRDKLAASDPG
jgi:hypothetical protein